MSGAWDSGNELALASDDKQLSISDIGGQTLGQHSLKGEASEVRFRAKDDGQQLSTVVAGRALVVLDATDPEQLRMQTELSFPSGHGSIVSYDWFGASHVCIGFESGHVVVVNCETSGGNEVYSTKLFPTTYLLTYLLACLLILTCSLTPQVFSTKLFPNGCTELAVSPLLMRAAACSGNMIKVVQLGNGDDAADYKELQDEGMVLQTDGGSLEHLSWTRDGQILSVSSDEGGVSKYVSKYVSK